MQQSLTEDKRLDLNLPLLSARRHSVQLTAKSPTYSQETKEKPKTPSWRSAVPNYKSDLKSGPLRNPGAVPFVWEQKPGQPKTGAAPRNCLPPVPSLPPGRNPYDASEELLKVKEEDEDDFADAADALSLTESFSMDCSLSGISGIPDVVLPYGRFSKDPHIKELMMDRFLPAAQALATGSPQYFPRKPVKPADRVGESRVGRERLPYQHRPNFVSRYPRDETGNSDNVDDDDYGNNYEGGFGRFTSKACGLLPQLCLRSSLCLLNPMSGIKKVGDQRTALMPPSTSRKISNAMGNNVQLAKAEDELWEAVFKHKLRLGITDKGESGSKSTTLSNRQGQWSDSQTLDESTSCCHSGGSGETLVETVKKDMKDGKSEGSESLDRDGERYWGMSPSHGSQQGSCTPSPTVMNSVYVTSGILPGNSYSSKHSSTDSEIGFRAPKETNISANTFFEDTSDDQRIEEKATLESREGFVLQPQSSELYQSGSVLCSGRSPLVNCKNESALIKRENQTKADTNLHSLLPPPLPKTPSESWLSRTLPYISAKIPSGHPSLGIHILRRKHGIDSSCTYFKPESDSKPLESLHPQVACVVAKQKIPSEPSKLRHFQRKLIDHHEESHSKPFEPQNDPIHGIKPTKPSKRQIRFSDVLTTPLSPQSEM